MELRFLSEHLQKRLPYVAHAVSSRSQLPILLNFLLEAKEGKLFISATDLEIGIQTAIPATIVTEGAITVPAKVFSELIASFGSEEITLKLVNTGLEISSKKSKSILQTIPSDEFPMLYEKKGEEIAILKKDKAVEDFSKIIFAASIDSVKPQLAGMLLQKQENGILLVATDGYRLSLLTDTGVQLQREDTDQKPLLIPARVIKEVCNMKDEGDISVSLLSENNQILFSQSDTILIGRLIESEFPNYRKIIPTDSATQVTFQRDDMQKAVKTCSIFARETANIIKFSLQKDKIVVSANTPSLGENSVDVEATLTGEENEIAFNARYLLDLFANVAEEKFIFEMTGPLNSGLFKIANNPSFLHIIMPIHVQG